jgi:hypothetical protein
MRAGSGLEPPGKGDSAWRGKQSEAVAPPQQPWQQQAQQAQDPGSAGRGFWERSRVSLWVLLFAGLVAWFVRSVSFAPIQTPLIALEAARYEWPLPPNAWAQEDLDGLATLHAQNIFVTHLPVERQNAGEVLAALDAQLNQAGSGQTPPETLVIYISMLGTLDEAAVPCLVPPGASPLESDQWLALPKLLNRIKQHRELEDCYKLIVLDSGRVLCDWRLCTLYNGFADRLASAVSAAQVPHLAVLNSTGPGQLGWSSTELEASTFGYYLRLGLAGLADTETGNGDRHVSLHELHRYLADRVDAWAVFNRAVHQRPLLLPADAEDFPVVWSLNRRTQERLKAPPIVKRQVPVTDNERRTLWSRCEQLAGQAPYQADPLTWRDFQQRLLWLDQAAAAGKSYSTSARNTYAELISQSLSMTVAQRGAPTGDLAVPLTAHSVPLAEYLGQSIESSVESRLAGLSHAATPEAIDRFVAYLDQFDGDQLVERQFLRLLSRYDLPALLKPPALLGRALEVRELAERTALPGDARALAAIEAPVRAADELRRLAEDLWLSAQDSQRSQAVANWTAAEAGYAKARAASDQWKRAWALCDRAWAELPYLAAWLCRPLPLGQNAAANDGHITEMLLPLLEETRAMATALDRDGWDETAQQTLAHHVAKVSDGLELLDAFVAAEGQRLLKPDEPAAARSLHGIHALLGMPLVPAQMRDQLLNRSAELNARLQTEFVAGKAPGQAAAAQPVSYAERAAARWPMHPALAMLNTDRNAPADNGAAAASGTPASPADAAVKLAAWNTLLRTRLIEMPMDLQRQLATSAASNELAGQAALRQAASRVRAVSAYWFPPLERDPVEALAQRDLQWLLLWQAARMLDDFLGPAEDGEPPYFRLIADAYLESVKHVGETSSSIEQESARIARLRDERLKAARSGVAIRASDLLLTDVATDATATVDLMAARRSTPNDLPTGVATVFLHDSQGRLSAGTQTATMPPVAASTVIKYPLTGAALAGRGPLVEASWLYRGNEISTSLLLRPPGGLKVDFEPYRYGPPRVTIHGRSRKKASIMFILDCSHSMTELTSSEGPGADQRVSRFTVAQKALQQMLEELAEDDARVGVRFFGHRVGWNTKQAGQLLRQPDYPGDIPDDLVPSMDVELALPLGRFDESVAEPVIEKLKKIKPWGESPLYLALIEALGDFIGEPEDSEKSIVVIADGANYQFNAPDPKTRDEVIAAFKGRNVAINIVGFEIPATEAAEARRDFTLLGKETGGSFVTAANATTLIKTLEKLLGPQDFRVLDRQDGLVGKARLGVPVVVTPPPERPQTYTVSLDRLTASVELSGGESVELFPSRDGSRLETARYDAGDPRYVPVLNGLHETSGYLLGLHRPVLVETAAHFPLSIVREDHSFASRPKEVWIEIRPGASAVDKAGQVAVFYDADYQPGTSVPVENCVADNWPAAAKTAVISAWFKRQPTPPARVLSFGDLQGRKSEAEPLAPLDGLPGVGIQLRLDRDPQSRDDFRLAVVERHDLQSPTLAALKVETVPMAQRVVHRFDNTNRVVTHQFFFRRVPKDGIDSYELRLTLASDAKADAYAAEPTEVVVSVASDLIRLVPPKKN